MGRLDRIKENLFRFILDNERKVKESYAEKRVPADYSLGALNTAIFIYHQLTATPGLARYYGRHDNNEFEVGCYPVPVVLKSPELAHADSEFRRIAYEVLSDLSDDKYENAVRYALEMYNKGEKHETENARGEQEETAEQPTLDEFAQGRSPGNAVDESKQHDADKDYVGTPV